MSKRDIARLIVITGAVVFVATLLNQGKFWLIVASALISLTAVGYLEVTRDNPESSKKLFSAMIIVENRKLGLVLMIIAGAMMMLSLWFEFLSIGGTIIAAVGVWIVLNARNKKGEDQPLPENQKDNYTKIRIKDHKFVAILFAIVALIIAAIVALVPLPQLETKIFGALVAAFCVWQSYKYFNITDE